MATLSVHFDNRVLNDDSLKALSQKWVMFDNTFKLGVCMAREFKLVIEKSDFDPNVQNIVIKYDNKDYAHLILDSYKIIEGGSIQTVELSLVDRMVKANFEYDASLITPCTTKVILNDICNKMGVTLGNNSFINDDIYVDFWDNTVQARTYLSYIAECNGGYARIEEDGKLWLRQFSNLNTQPIDTELCENINIGQGHQVQRVVFDNGLIKYETSSNDALETLYINSENVYIQNDIQFNKVANAILGFNYCNIDTGKTYILPTGRCGDVLSLDYNNQMYYTICQLDGLSFVGDWSGSYKLNINSALQEETQIIGTAQKIKAVSVKINRLDNDITILASNIGEFSSDIGELYLSDTEIRQSVTNIETNLGANYYTSTKTNELINTAKNGLINTFSNSGGTNLVRNSSLFFQVDGVYDFWTGAVVQYSYDQAVTRKALLLQKGKVTQTMRELTTGWFSLRFGFKKIGNGLGTKLQFEVNDVLYDIVPVEGFIEISFQNTSGILNLSFITDNSDEYVIYDIMLNYGKDVWLPYQQNANELKSTTVQISENIKIESNTSNTITILGTDGLEGYNKNTNALIFKQTDNGILTNFIKTGGAEISNIRISKVGDQVWITGL